MLQKLLHPYQIVLASKSPRRHELLKGMDVEFSIVSKDVDESFSDNLQPNDIALYLCEQKSKAFTNEELPANFLLITADTIVVVGHQILNKAVGKAEAIKMLELLSGRTHQVITGVCLRDATRQFSFTDRSEVKFGKLDADEINWYVDQYKPFDKAGAYGIQEWIGYIGIEKLTGSYFNVMGLPTYRLFHALKHFSTATNQQA